MNIRRPIPEHIESPFPILCSSQVVSGFGRGSAELGIPTANVPVDDLLNALDTGVYFGWCKLSPANTDQQIEPSLLSRKRVDFNYGCELSEEDLNVLPIVMSVGWNPFYNNTKKTAEVHVIHEFTKDFYGANIKLAILGYIRPELDYTTKEALIEDIKKDIEVADLTLKDGEYQSFKDKFGCEM
ncbi:CIC11C00000002156 [Sungouiella intermedia]|uniref:Riboflavin kinase n=1 Tax=Sungouiella intermedia TaxID=45354 RepID=A0A1L0B6R8_9ASCO|nr:CIC11C00000002156 [[Candida] intermedia]